MCSHFFLLPLTSHDRLSRDVFCPRGHGGLKKVEFRVSSSSSSLSFHQLLELQLMLG